MAISSVVFQRHTENVMNKLAENHTLETLIFTKEFFDEKRGV